MTVWGKRCACLPDPQSACRRARRRAQPNPTQPGFAAIAQIRVKCNEDDTVGDLKKLVAAQTGSFGGMQVRAWVGGGVE